MSLFGRKVSSFFQASGPATARLHALSGGAIPFVGRIDVPLTLHTGADGVLQADHFLDVVQPDPDTLLVLDLEANPQKPNMSLLEAQAFVTHVNEATGRWLRAPRHRDHLFHAIVITRSTAS